MNPRILPVLACLSLWVLGLGGPAAPARAHDDRPPVPAHPALEAIDLARDGEIARARALASKLSEPLLDKLVRWLGYGAEESDAGFAEIAGFIDENPDWPGLADLQRQAERTMPPDLPDARALSWFAARPPITPEGAMRYGATLRRAGERAKAREVLRNAWIKLDFSRAAETAFRLGHGTLLRREDELARLERLLWSGQHGAAERQARRLGGGYPALAEARARLDRMAPGVDAAIYRVPPELRDDPGLTYERARWRLRKGRYEDTVALLDPPDPTLPHAERWWPLRRWAARQAFERGEFERAYRLARAHGLESGLGFAEGEFTAGWLALRFLDRPERAYEHFARLHAGVGSPVSVARAAFWAGEAAHVLAERAIDGNWRERAGEWYRKAAEHGTVFYGQLAAKRLGRPLEVEALPVAAPEPQARAAFARRELARVAALLGAIGERHLQERFLQRLIFLADGAEDFTLVADFARGQSRPDLAVRTAKMARLNGIILARELFPDFALPDGRDPEPALVLSLILQESGFYDEAISRAGARGLMQLMPGTARHVARKLRIAYRGSERLYDPHYNLRLGRAYLSEMTDRFGGSYILALAAYNAGPARAEQWIRAYGDPRDPDVDPIDWIESLPFEETRNYVQRILEALPIYRAQRGAERADPLPLPALTPYTARAER